MALAADIRAIADRTHEISVAKALEDIAARAETMEAQYDNMRINLDFIGEIMAADRAEQIAAHGPDGKIVPLKGRELGPWQAEA
jgi:hypothetical protein